MMGLSPLIIELALSQKHTVETMGFPTFEEQM
jgi:hypothetical protein